MTLSISLASAQRVYFSHTDGTNAAYNLTDVRKLTFDLDLLKLHMLDGTIYTRNVSTIGHYQHSESSVNVENLLSDINDWNLHLYPNPTKDELQLRYNLQKGDKITISLFDLQGKLLLVKETEKSPGENQDTLDLRQIAPGTYICRISGTVHSISKQIIKQ